MNSARFHRLSACRSMRCRWMLVMPESRIGHSDLVAVSPLRGRIVAMEGGR